MDNKKKQDFSHYVSEILQNSMLTGIPQIASAGNWPKKVVRTLVFVLCVAGFIFQSLQFMRMYWEYEVVVDVRVTNPTYEDRPSFTVCIMNGFKTIEFCEDPEAEEVKKQLGLYCAKFKRPRSAPYLCDCNPRLCDIDGNLRNLTFLADWHPVLHAQRDLVKKWMLRPLEIMSNCFDIKMRAGQKYLDCGEKYYLEIPCQYEDVYPESCFTANSLIGRPNYTMEKVFTDAEIRIQLEFFEDFVPIDEKRNQLHISIHNQYTVLNPFSNGFTLRAGYNYVFHLKKVVKKLLPYPYATDCKDYRSEWYAKGGKGPTNLKECMLECQKNLSLERHGCLLTTIYIPGDEERCSSYLQDETLFRDAQVCSTQNCKPACDEEYYVVTEDAEEYNFINCAHRNYKERIEDSYAFIKMDGMETTSYSYSPKFEDIETFSYLGGYVGMWLGISLVAVFDFVETLFVMLKYPMRRLMLYRSRRKTRDHIRRFQRSL